VTGLTHLDSVLWALGSDLDHSGSLIALNSQLTTNSDAVIGQLTESFKNGMPGISLVFDTGNMYSLLYSTRRTSSRLPD
jgi:hypothetical protein